MFLAAGHGSPQYWDRPGGVDGRIYRSEDGGQTWRQVGAGLPAKHTAMCWQLAYNPYNKNSIFAAFGDVARGHTAGPPGQGAIYVTYDRGDTWEEVALQKRGTKVLTTSGNSCSLGSGRRITGTPEILILGEV